MNNSPKNVLIVGGTGFVGNAFLRQALLYGSLKLSSVSRHLPPATSRFDNVTYIQGDSLKPEDFQEAVREADVIIHSVGVLIDSHVQGKAEIGGEGSYEQINFETARNLGQLANSFDDKKRRFFYISANVGLPFVPRYMLAKQAAEEYLGRLENIDFTTFRPGFLYAGQQQKWRNPLANLMKVFNFMQPEGLKRSIREGNGPFRRFLSNFLIEPPTSVEDLAGSLIYSALAPSTKGKQVVDHKGIEAEARKLQQMERLKR